MLDFRTNKDSQDRSLQNFGPRIEHVLPDS